MKFAHLADCHLGSWSNHPDMRDYPVLAFENAINMCIAEKVDFIIIAGDLFDTSLPPIDVMRHTATKLRECRENNIAIYVIPGSHDYSPSGKTIISVFEEAGLLVNVFKYDEVGDKIKLKFTTDKKTSVKLTGIMGRKGSLEISFYKRLDKSIEDEKGFKIFVFHAGLEDYKPGFMKEMIAVPSADLPKGFNYYASGHVHTQMFDEKLKVVFPGELFPTSFDELEDYNGGFVIVDTANGLDVKWKNARLFDVVLIKINADNMTPRQIENELMKKIDTSKIDKKILLIKVQGTMDGKTSDIDFNPSIVSAKEKGAIIVKRSTSGLHSKEFEAEEVQSLSVDEIERKLISQHRDSLKLQGIDIVEDFVSNMMNALKEEKQEDETNATFEERLKENVKRVVGL
ncbi:MAG: exonuclease SbcCD subunit D [Candidatus Aenigmarchaeota archaeon]|nr:exonuclease SbcCD subunit D [Candidatus Aenigmarchaeota archaeon]